MRLRALNTIQFPERTIPPGVEFDAGQEDADYLITAGAALPIEDEIEDNGVGEETKPEKKQSRKGTK